MRQHNLYFSPSMNVFCTVVSEHKINKLVAVDVVEGNTLQGELYLVKESELVKISALTSYSFMGTPITFDYVPANITMMGFHALSDATLVVAHHQPSNQLILINANVAMADAVKGATNPVVAALATLS
tara:strand:+ start:2732 stop:3115 length:384 start_codon:yes stop_codon:yes gene_type:complete